jgi:hypothetical protein
VLFRLDLTAVATAFRVSPILSFHLYIRRADSLSALIATAVGHLSNRKNCLAMMSLNEPQAKERTYILETCTQYRTSFLVKPQLLLLLIVSMEIVYGALFRILIVETPFYLIADRIQFNNK